MRPTVNTTKINRIFRIVAPIVTLLGLANLGCAPHFFARGGVVNTVIGAMFALLGLYLLYVGYLPMLVASFTASDRARLRGRGLFVVRRGGCGDDATRGDAPDGGERSFGVRGDGWRRLVVALLQFVFHETRIRAVDPHDSPGEAVRPSRRL